MTRTYLDHAANSPLRPEARAAMEPLLDSANPSSLHEPGRLARAAIDRARAQIAALLGCKPREIVFTSGGTEANTAAILGLAHASPGPRRVVTSAVEHQAVSAACDALADGGWDIVHLPVDAHGLVEPADLSAALEEPAALVTIMLANNETGAIQPLMELAAIARTRGVLFHTDAVQAPGALPLLEVVAAVDALSLSAQKFGGPLGCGVFYVRTGTPFRAVVAGSQEAGRRPGTESVAAIAGTAAALATACAHQDSEALRLGELRDSFEAYVAGTVQDALIHAREAARLPGISSISFRGAGREELLVALDLAGVDVSTGSACAAGTAERSHVLRAMGAPAWALTSVLRFSLGHTTTEADVTKVSRMLPSIVESVRSELTQPIRGKV